MADQLEARETQLLSHVSGLALCEGLGEKLPGAVRQAVKMHEADWPSDGLESCAATVELMASMHEVFRSLEQVYRLLLPQKLSLSTPAARSEVFRLSGLDAEGRAVYRCAGPAERAFLRWREGGEGGAWAAHTDADGRAPGDLRLDSALPTDAGTWQDAEGCPAEAVTCVRTDTPLLDERSAEELQRCLGAASAAGFCEAVAGVLQSSGLGQKQVSSDEPVIEVLRGLLEALCSVAEKCNVGSAQRPKSATWQELLASALSLAQLGGGPAWAALEARLPASAAGFEITWLQCRTYMRRVLEVCDLRLASEPALLRLFHRLLLLQWQEACGGSARVLDLQGKRSEAREAGPQPAGSLRCVVVSDTHGWGPELKLPRGDVLFHCGNLLLSGAGLGAAGAAPPDLRAALMALHGPEYQAFRWIFLVGGSHDRPLHELWAEDPDALYELLPPNVVLLQAPAKLEPPLPGTCAAREPGVRACAADGAVKLLPDLMLCPPGGSRTGWVIAGSGASLAAGAGPADRAFQLPGEDAEARAQAAEALLWHSPCVVLTHGPPAGRRDRGRGDAELAEAVGRCSSVQVHLFGHVPEAYGAEFANGRAYVNAATTTPFYVPTQEPVLFDLPGKLEEPPLPAVEPAPPVYEPPVLGGDGRTVRVRGLKPGTTPWEICLSLRPFPVAQMALAQRAEGLEATVLFMRAQDGARARSHFRGRGLDLADASAEDLGQVERATGRSRVCLFDILSTKGCGDRLTAEEIDAGFDAGILPRENTAGR